MSISCCCCYFDYYLLKINRQPEFLKKIESLNEEDWPKNPVATDLSFPHARSVSSWYSQATGLLFYACKPCILWILEISAAANDADVNDFLGRMCYFVNSQWISTEENCLDKIYFSLGSRGGVTDLDACPRCKLNLCLSVIYIEFNCLDRSYVVKNVWKFVVYLIWCLVRMKKLLPIFCALCLV